MKKFLSIALLGGALMLSGCGDDRDDFVWTDNGPAMAAPIAVADAFTVNANSTLTVPVANSVLVNDTANGGTLAFPATGLTTNGGTIAGLANGTFTYTPAVDFFGTDTFTYTLANSGGASTATVTITVAPVNAFIVDAATGSDATGSFTNGRPFATVQTAVAAAGTGVDIVVRPGSYTGAVNLKDGQRLLGSGSSLIAAQGAVKPVLSGPIDMADGNTIDSIRVSGTAGDAIVGDGQNGGTVTNCEFANVTNLGSAFQGLGIRGAWTVSNNSLDSLPVAAVILQTVNSDILTMRIEGNSFTNCSGAIAVSADNSSQMTTRIADNSIVNHQGGNSAVEINVGDDVGFRLDLESNENEGSYRFALLTGGTASFGVEQLNSLDVARPLGAGNSGTINILSGGSFGTLDELADGACGF